MVMLGPNGHGKFTFLKSICGLVNKVTGIISYKGENITGQGSEKLVDKGITYIAENRELFPEMSVLENLKLVAYSRSTRPHEKKNLEKLLPKKKLRLKKLIRGEASLYDFSIT
ncbi:MAG: ATP-binding cassette domain-containing protein [Desulfobacula sp.]|nr:ATP-binding cassette domain-containing protein [Desulfobacula sp.]